MSFLRPEARATLWRWREVALTGGLTLWGVHMIGRAVAAQSLTLGMVGVVLTGTATTLLFFAILRMRLVPPGQSPGVVEVDERKVGYLSADGGGFVSIDDLTRLEVVANAAGAQWVLTHLGGPPLMIPANADGAEQLFDTFAALPGLQIEDAVRAVSAGPGRHRVWQRG
ncbi:MAG: hypothetical protein AAF393_07990 [Pseudomonadota bacterium]